jgi:pSer/pThr/pTyr-binding forkhead associated (FHA) protein
MSDQGSRRVAVRVRNIRGTVIHEREIEEFPLIIGRGKEDEKDIDADLAIDDPRCSRLHVLIESAEDGIWLTDQGSTNGTFSTEGKRLTKVQLRNRTRIRIGSHWLEFRIEDDEDRTLVDTSPTPPLEYREEPTREPDYQKEPELAKKVEPKPVVAPVKTSRPKVRSAKDGPDVLDRFEKVACSHGLALTILTLSCARVGYWQSGSLVSKVAAIFGTGFFILLAAVVLAGVTALVARIFASKPPEFARLWRAYVSLIAARQFFSWLVYDAMLIWPAHRYLDPWLPIVATMLVGLYLCFNSRWIFGFGTPRVSAVGAVWAVGMLLFYVPELKPQPSLWLKIVKAPTLNSQPRRLPASMQVPEEQFLHELSESIVVLQDKK